jgi:DNA (cytosine-5)-methyltransferase 1
MSPLPIVAIDFFCGAGGMTNGFIRAGIHVLGGVDNQPLCEKTYIQNKNADGSSPAYLCKNIFPQSKAHPDGQQHEISASIRSLLDDYKRTNNRRKVKLVFAICAPCQPFTKITKIEMSEVRKFKRDNDSNLLLTTAKLIEEFRPDAIVCENVEGIADGNKSSILGKFNRKLKSLEYSFGAKVINASKFGVPQNRRRTICIGYNTKLYPLKISIPELDDSLDNFVTVAQTIGHLPSIAPGEIHPSIPNHRARSLSPLNLKRISCAPPGSSNSYLQNTPYGNLSLDCHKRFEQKWGELSFTDTYTRMRGEDVGPTITTKCISITNGRFGHYDTNQNRALTPREAALLQTFPEDYVFFPEENIEFSARLIGNAVPPRLAKFFGSAIVTTISKKPRKRSAIPREQIRGRAQGT